MKSLDKTKITIIALSVAVAALLLSTCIYAYRYGQQKDLAVSQRQELGNLSGEQASTRNTLTNQADKIEELTAENAELTAKNAELQAQVDGFEPYIKANNVQIDDLLNQVQSLSVQVGNMSPQEIIANTYTMTKESYESDTAKFGYWLYQPNYPENGDDLLPMIISLHSGNGTGSNLDQLVNYDHGLCRYLYEEKLSPNAIIVMPQSPIGWTSGFDELFEFIDAMANLYNVDKDRISITGVSRGGVATFEMLQRHDDYFYRAMPIASACDPQAAKNIKTPLWIIHGELDTGMGFSVVTADELINANGGNSKLQMLEGIGHSGQNIYYDDPEVMDWLTGVDES